MSVSQISLDRETKVAYSDAGYAVPPGETEGAKLGKLLGKPGVKIKNLLVIPATPFFSTLTGSAAV